MTGRGRARAALFAVLVLAGTVPGAAVAQQGGSAVCPAPGQTDRYADDAGNIHEANVNCAARYGLVRGMAPTTFAPERRLTRGQAATILVSYVEWSRNTPLQADPAADFADIAGNVHAGNIEKAADNGVVTGFTNRTFRPEQVISRAQFATMATRATELVLGSPLGRNPSDDFDDDDGNVHEANIEKAVDNRIVQGTGPRRFAPDANVTRAQAATIVIRGVSNVLYPAGAIAP